jgi:hypothetical protein
MAVALAGIGHRLQRDFDSRSIAVFLSAQSVDFSRFAGGINSGLETNAGFAKMARFDDDYRVCRFVGFNSVPRAAYRERFQRCGKFASR